MFKDTAARHLSSEQFMTIHELKDSTSGDFPQWKVGQLHRDQATGGYHKYDWDKLHADIDTQGMRQPLHVTHDPYEDDSPVLRNGHHRAVAAMERGMMFVPTTDQHQETEGNYRYSKVRTQRSKPHWFVGNSVDAPPPKPKPEIPGQQALFPGPMKAPPMQGRQPPKRKRLTPGPDQISMGL